MVSIFIPRALKNKLKIKTAEEDLDAMWKMIARLLGEDTVQ